ncbi:MAG: glycerol-3-phosphate responsive antiterminator [Clostridiales bacterium]|nr:glycerol-3-phosphate responsive antiterminator [Clostridiales bacterium]
MERKKDFFKSHVIAAVRDEEGVLEACSSPVSAAVLLGGDIMTMPGYVEKLRAHGKLSFVHIDLMEGIAKDSAGVRYIARQIRPDGLISTKAQLLHIGADEGLKTIMRMFLVDSASLIRGEKLARAASPDYIEVLPGLVPKAIIYLCSHLNIPVIAGGMITTGEDVKTAISAGAIAVSTSNKDLWNM